MSQYLVSEDQVKKALQIDSFREPLIKSQEWSARDFVPN